VVEIGIAIARTLYRLYPDTFELAKFDRLLGHAATIEGIRNGMSLAEIRQTWTSDIREFLERRKEYLIYD
jgi:uncharacterized protein YbbC (DUF1343 family)